MLACRGEKFFAQFQMMIIGRMIIRPYKSNIHMFLEYPFEP